MVLILCLGELSIQDVSKLKGMEINSAQGCKEVCLGSADQVQIPLSTGLKSERKDSGDWALRITGLVFL